LRRQAPLDIFNLLVASDELLLEELIEFIEKYMIEELDGWLQRNLVKVLHKLFQLESCKNLQNYCLECICEDPVPFFKLYNFPTLEKNILLGLVKGDLQIDEIDLWDHLIRWGIAQNWELEETRMINPSSWHEEDFLVLKGTLKPFIPYIRFFEISSKDFHNKIRPFMKVLPEELFEEIVAFHMTDYRPRNILPPRYGQIAVDSMIIEPKHTSVLSKWVQKKEANAIIPKDSKYNFNLIYRGSRDGYDIDTIRRKCNGYGACMLVIKTRGGAIIGGYNPLGWKYNQIENMNRNNNMFRNRHNNSSVSDVHNNYWINTSESFIFSFGDGDLKNKKISRVANSYNAIYESNICHLALGSSL